MTEERKYFLNETDLKDHETAIGHKVQNPIIGASEPKQHKVTVEAGFIVPVEEKKKVPPLITYSGSDLAKMNLKPPEFIVKNKIPAGLGIIAAPSKAGKSWLMLDLAISAAKGSLFLRYETNKSGVLYLALEDSLYRVEERGKQILKGEALPEGLHIAIESKKTNDGLDEQIREYLTTHSDTKLIIIDTFQMIKPPRGKKDAYEFDYEVMGKLRKLIKDYNICILLVHHTRKTGGINADPFEEILGSTALQGATDFMLVLKKKPDEDISTLYGKGRDFESYELALKMDWHTYKWENLGDAEALEHSRMEREYNTHPAVITIKDKLDSIMADDSEPVKEYVGRMKDIRDDVIEHTGEVVGTSERNFSSIVSKFDVYLYRDGIMHVEPAGRTTYRDKRGLFHRYKYM